MSFLLILIKFESLKENDIVFVHSRLAKNFTKKYDLLGEKSHLEVEHKLNDTLENVRTVQI